MTDESDEWLRGPKRGSTVPVTPPPWTPKLSAEQIRRYADICRAELDDAGVLRPGQTRPEPTTTPETECQTNDGTP